jgi:hypothetical protein
MKRADLRGLLFLGTAGFLWWYFVRRRQLAGLGAMTKAQRKTLQDSMRECRRRRGKWNRKTSACALPSTAVAKPRDDDEKPPKKLVRKGEDVEIERPVPPTSTFEDYYPLHGRPTETQQQVSQSSPMDVFAEQGEGFDRWIKWLQWSADFDQHPTPEKADALADITITSAFLASEVLIGAVAKNDELRKQLQNLLNERGGSGAWGQFGWWHQEPTDVKSAKKFFEAYALESSTPGSGLGERLLFLYDVFEFVTRTTTGHKWVAQKLSPIGKAILSPAPGEQSVMPSMLIRRTETLGAPMQDAIFDAWQRLYPNDENLVFERVNVPRETREEWIRRVVKQLQEEAKAATGGKTGAPGTKGGKGTKGKKGKTGPTGAPPIYKPPKLPSVSAPVSQWQSWQYGASEVDKQRAIDALTAQAQPLIQACDSGTLRMEQADDAKRKLDAIKEKLQALGAGAYGFPGFCRSSAKTGGILRPGAPSDGDYGPPDWLAPYTEPSDPSGGLLPTDIYGRPLAGLSAEEDAVGAALAVGCHGLLGMGV